MAANSVSQSEVTEVLTARLVDLEQRVHEIDQVVRKEGRRPRPDTLLLQRMKRQRLWFQDKISSCRRLIRKLADNQAAAHAQHPYSFWAF